MTTQINKSQFDKTGYITLNFSYAKTSIKRLYKTLAIIKKKRIHYKLIKILTAILPKFMQIHFLSVLPDHMALAVALPNTICTVLEKNLKLRLTMPHDSLDQIDFSHWMNTQFPSLSNLETLLNTELNNHTFYTQQAIKVFTQDLEAIGEFLQTIMHHFKFYTDNKNIHIEQAHVKTWPKEEYKAHWWHLDRGIISAIATIEGNATTQYLLYDPSEYPQTAPGYDVFVHPAVDEAHIHSAPQDAVLICGARLRKEKGQSYLWHRAPLNGSKRIVLIIKTKQERARNNFNI